MKYNIIPLIPRSEWFDSIKAFNKNPKHPYRPAVHSQETQPKCTAEAAITMMEHLAAIQKIKITFDANKLYERIAQPNGGANIGDAIEELMNYGQNTCKLSIVYYCPTFDHMMTAAIKGYPQVANINMYPNYKPTNLSGWVQQGKGTPLGHSIYGFKPAVRAEIRTYDYEYGIWFMNSQGNWSPLTENCMVIPESELPVALGGSFAGVYIN